MFMIPVSFFLSILAEITEIQLQFRLYFEPFHLAFGLSCCWSMNSLVLSFLSFFLVMFLMFSYASYIPDVSNAHLV